MRLIARRVAAVVAVVLGLACVSLAAFGSDSPTIGPPPAPHDHPAIGTIPPLGPRSGVKADRITTPTDTRTPDVFSSEFGQRGKHVVTVSVRGQAYYLVTWRDKKSDKGFGTVRKTRTVNGGFPLVQVAVQAYEKGNGSGCSVTIDGHEKDVQVTTRENWIVFCQA